ncbi:pseudouridine synthase [Mycena floridula]|nr:pseudouridine synthase [Mycena floridula]
MRARGPFRAFIPPIPLPDHKLFSRIISRFITSTQATLENQVYGVAPLNQALAGPCNPAASPVVSGIRSLKKIAPYWYPYTTRAKQRWVGRGILEIFTSEFRDRSMEYYIYALESGVISVNGKVALPDTIIRNEDLIENIVHRHEPPVTAAPVKVLSHDVEREFIVVDKPGSIPVHATGRYYHTSLMETLINDFNFAKIHPVNRLDRLTSGIMIIPTSASSARIMSDEIGARSVEKVYVARCTGKFPDGRIVCEEPILTVERHIGLHIVHPDGKPSQTIFNLMRYDAHTDSSVVLCKPVTGRTHQIRVHLQYLGHPIANDTIYNEQRIWGTSLGKSGLNHMDKSISNAPSPPLLKPTLSSEVQEIITKLQNKRDEDWGRWRDVVFKAKTHLQPHNVQRKKPQNRKQNDVQVTTTSDPQFTTAQVLERVTAIQLQEDPLTTLQSEHAYCPECYLPLLPDPKPEELYIFLHALRYTTSFGSFETEMPEWSREDWVW